MRILGIDPGPDGIAWAIYDDKPVIWSPPQQPDIVDWGICEGSVECLGSLTFSAVGIEDVHSYGHPMSNDLRDTAVTIGHVEQWVWDHRPGVKIVRLSRKTIAAAITHSVKSGDKEINAMMAKVCPALVGRRRGLNSHHRAAAAVAYVAAGRVK